MTFTLKCLLKAMFICKLISCRVKQTKEKPDILLREQTNIIVRSMSSYKKLVFMRSCQEYLEKKTNETVRNI